MSAFRSIATKAPSLLKVRLVPILLKNSLVETVKAH
jgi:hypothetical protein